MSGFDKLGYGVSPEQQSLLQQHNFSLQPLGTVGHLSLWRAFLTSWQPIAAFLFTALILVPIDLRSSSEGLVLAIHAVGAAALLLYPAVALCMLAGGIAATRVHSRVRWSAVLYWTWWPASTLLMCCLAVALGTTLGSRVWQDDFLPYVQVERLQAYQHVDPGAAGAVRLQDAGVVLFNGTATVDRLAAGCHKSGSVYCVAPILGAGGAHHGLFVAGQDCCACPGEFRCGDWSSSAPLGGLRVVDSHENKLYKLAAEDWAASRGRRPGRALFLRWTAGPLEAHRSLLNRGRRVLGLGLVAGPCLLLALAAALNGILGLLVDAKWAAPMELPTARGARSGQGRPGGDEVGMMPADPKYVCL